MSTASFDPFHFLMQISPDLLSRYAKHHEIGFSTAANEAGETVAEECVAVLEKEPENKQAQFWLDVYDIDEIGTGNGCDALLHRACVLDDWDQAAYQELKNAKERSMYFYLHHYGLFCETSEEYNLENLQGWRAEKTVAKSPDEIIGNIGTFEEGLKTLYGKEYKGKYLKVKFFQKEDRMVFVAYIEDAFVNDLSFKKGNLNPKTPRKPVFMAYFLYRNKEGILEVKAQGGKERIQQLQREFIRHMLGETASLTDAARYDFERVRDIENLRFPIEAQDAVDRVTLKGLRMVHITSKARISIDLGNVTAQGTAPMIESLERMHINLSDYRINQFKVEVVFSNGGTGRRKKVTAAITYPNMCDLKDRSIDATVRGLLKRWKLDLF